jgi:hypothetical protein
VGISKEREENAEEARKEKFELNTKFYYEPKHT